MIDSGSCDSHGYVMVESKNECEKAATILSLMDTTGYESQTKDRPYGCIYADNDWLNWYSPDGATYPSALCGSFDGEHYYSCICRKGMQDYI